MDGHTNQCDSGWAVLGQACIWWAAFICGEQLLVLPALTCKEIIALDIFEGAINKECFIHFVQQPLGSEHDTFMCSIAEPDLLQAPKLTPYPGPCSVVVLDNCAIHHDEEICPTSSSNNFNLATGCLAWDG